MRTMQNSHEVGGKKATAIRAAKEYFFPNGQRTQEGKQHGLCCSKFQKTGVQHPLLLFPKEAL